MSTLIRIATEHDESLSEYIFESEIVQNALEIVASDPLHDLPKEKDQERFDALNIVNQV